MTVKRTKHCGRNSGSAMQNLPAHTVFERRDGTVQRTLFVAVSAPISRITLRQIGLAVSVAEVTTKPVLINFYDAPQSDISHYIAQYENQLGELYIANKNKIQGE